MSERDKKPTIDELLKRIESLEGELERLAKGNFQSHEIIRYHLEVHDRQIDEGLERIKTLELHAFPQVAADIVAIHQVIGDGESRADNPLDRRKE